MDDLISVIVPIYNVEKYLHKCVNSICNQTYKNLEIILVDDGSPDSCGKICDEFAKKDNRIKVIHKSNGGLSDARNAGLDIMTGKYVSFVDSDDWIEKDMCETLLSNIKEFNTDISFAGIFNDIEKSDVVIATTLTNVFVEPFSENNKYAMKRYFLNSWAAWDKLYKAKLFEHIRFPFGEINEDEAIALQILSQCENVSYCGKALYHYIRREGQNTITTSPFSNKKMSWYYHCKDNLSFIEENIAELVPYAKFRYFKSIIWTLNHISLNPKEFHKFISPLRKNLREILYEKEILKMFNKKEIIRIYCLVYVFNIYSFVVRILKKNYT